MRSNNCIFSIYFKGETLVTQIIETYRFFSNLLDILGAIFSGGRTTPGTPQVSIPSSFTDNGSLSTIVIRGWK